jgi:innexin
MRDTYMRYLVKNIDQYVDDQRRYEDKRQMNKLTRFVATTLPCFGRYLGNYIVILYFIVKIFYILNTCLQIYLCSFLLGKNFWQFGFDFFLELLKGEGWSTASANYFPK